MDYKMQTVFRKAKELTTDLHALQSSHKSMEVEISNRDVLLAQKDETIDLYAKEIDRLKGEFSRAKAQVDPLQKEVWRLSDALMEQTRIAENLRIDLETALGESPAVAAPKATAKKQPSRKGKR